ncbi:9145_t:CDS:2, partial [Racocetra fulgida]
MEYYAFIWLLIAISMIINVIPVTSKPNSITLIKNAPKHSLNEIFQFNRDYLTSRYEHLTRGPDQYALNKLASAEKRSKTINIAASEFGYFGPVVIGGQKFNVRFSLADSDLWVSNSSLIITNIYIILAESLSKTFRPLNTNYAISYGPTVVQGVLGNDKLLVNRIKSDQIFGLTHSENGFLKKAVFDGMFGLGFDSLSHFNTTSPFSKMVKQKAVKNPYFGLHISGEGDVGTLTFGDIDKTKFTGKLNYHNVSTINGEYVFWMTNADNISINGKKLKYKKKMAIFDTSAYAVFMSSDDADAYHKLIKGSEKRKISNDVGEAYVVPCNTTVK